MPYSGCGRSTIMGFATRCFCFMKLNETFAKNDLFSQKKIFLKLSQLLLFFSTYSCEWTFWVGQVKNFFRNQVEYFCWDYSKPWRTVNKQGIAGTFICKALSASERLSSEIQIVICYALEWDDTNCWNDLQRYFLLIGKNWAIIYYITWYWPQKHSF